MLRPGVPDHGEEGEKEAPAWNCGLGLKQRQTRSRPFQHDGNEDYDAETTAGQTRDG